MPRKYRGRLVDPPIPANINGHGVSKEQYAELRAKFVQDPYWIHAYAKKIMEEQLSQQ